MNEENQTTTKHRTAFRQFFRTIRKASKRFVCRLKRGTRQTTKRVRPKKTAQDEGKTEAVKPTPDFFESGDIRHNIDRIEKIIATGIFSRENNGNPLFMAAFTELMICLRDLTDKADRFAARISFTDDITITAEVYDVTQLIKFIRDAVCHIGIYNHFVVPNSVKASFNVMYGKGTLLKIGEITISSEHADDICFIFGLYKIYFRRHILRAYQEAKNELLPLLSRPGPKDVLNY